MVKKMNKKLDFFNLIPKQKTNIQPTNIMGSKNYKPKQITDMGVMDMFIGKGHPNPLDKKTKSQKKFMTKTRLGTGKSHMRFWDTDGDGVINGLDCHYKNHKKHGVARFKADSWEESKQMRDEAIENHYKQKGYYKYGGNDLQIQDDLEGGSVQFFGNNPVRRFAYLSSQKKRYLTPEEYDEQRNV